MPYSRRRLLVTGSVIGLGSGVAGYTQRRRIFRYSDLRTLRDIQDRPLPEGPEPLIVPDAYLADSRKRLDELVRRAREHGLSEDDDHIAYALDLRERAAEAAFSIEAAYDLSAARGATARILSWTRRETGDLTEADVEAEITDIRQRVDDTTLTYDIGPETHLMVSHHGAELALRSATGSLTGTERQSPSRRMEVIERATAYRDLAVSLSDGGDGDSREASLQALSRDLEERVANRMASVTHDFDPKYIRWRYKTIGVVGKSRTLASNGLFSGSPSDYGDEYPASVAVTRLRDLVLATVATDVGPEFAASYDTKASFADIGEIDEMKRNATDALESVPDDAMADPLVKLFSAAAVHAAECGDRQLQSAIERVNQLETGSWNLRLEDAFLGYRAALELAKEAPRIAQELPQSIGHYSSS
ncbi:hypothetical protein DV706_18000 (plasmid) [Natronorubrum bangense]|uniref:Uncharacterized protein n=2 Tax=Natronorubrum bangense TaxID=61858 RepID=A0A4D6HRN8_9EURY|nr:hypothetical protein DV706_18000 [Natronorubrum bangense]